MNISSEVVREIFKRQFFFDLARFPFSDQFHGLLKFAPLERLLYGGDYAFTPTKGVAVLAYELATGLEKTFSDPMLRAVIYSGNAKKLPSLVD